MRAHGAILANFQSEVSLSAGCTEATGGGVTDGVAAEINVVVNVLTTTVTSRNSPLPKRQNGLGNVKAVSGRYDTGSASYHAYAYNTHNVTYYVFKV